jgi:hypothetical protein
MVVSGWPKLARLSQLVGVPAAAGSTLDAEHANNRASPIIEACAGVVCDGVCSAAAVMAMLPCSLRNGARILIAARAAALLIRNV